MKIGINARAFTASEPGGSVQAAMNVTRRLIEKDETEVILFGHNSLQDAFECLYVEGSMYKTQNREMGVIWERTILPYLARSHNIDLLFAPNGNGPLTTQPFPIVMWVHDVGSMKGWMGPVHRLYRNLTVPRAAKVTDRIVTPSKFSKKEIVDEIGIDQDKIDVVYNGVSEFYHSETGSTPFDLPEKYILFVSSSLTFGNRKNLRAIMEVYQYLKNEYDLSHKLVLVGSNKGGVLEKTPLSEEEIVITGYVTEGELKYAYENADVFLFPSIHEGFGLPPLEAMACGTPVVVSSAASIPEVVGDAGEIIDPQDIDEFAKAIIKILSDKPHTERLVKKGRERSEKFTWEGTTDRILESFSTALEEMR